MVGQRATPRGVSAPVKMGAMRDPYVIGAAIVGVVNLVGAAVGLAQWALNRPARWFWPLARAGQFVAAVFAVLCGIYAVAVEPPPDGLMWVYVLTPVAVSFFAEQLRLIAANTVLERHGYATSAELRAAVEGGDPEAARMATGIAHETLLRELAVLALAALVIAFLAWRGVLTG